MDQEPGQARATETYNSETHEPVIETPRLRANVKSSQDAKEESRHANRTENDADYPHNRGPVLAFCHHA